MEQMNFEDTTGNTSVAQKEILVVEICSRVMLNRE